MTTYVTHDGARWRVAGSLRIDDEPGYELIRRVPGRPPLAVVARERDCQPDTHEPVRVLRDDKAVLRLNVKRGMVTLQEPGRRTRYVTTLFGLLQMCARAQAAMKAREKAFAKRTGKR